MNDDGYTTTIQVEGPYGTELQQVVLYSKSDPIYDASSEKSEEVNNVSYRFDIIFKD